MFYILIFAALAILLVVAVLTRNARARAADRRRPR